ncbi:hypothetical protein GLOTRDRAFT_106294 [Gloeophyllum trabeum ATCC 11539]|uniref:DUF7702 domain-containing protein n=1 Tax=Gloeophyllum trabeum (strain ATCC 11539 / FP-39264 / Madison 617) TaxID=670483 RepID=S7Q3Q9_GLOTA|nr:uncharacterized protein GLOTRDRAFT_106294 [Gloeophyllum trabeum ATCC 11539]EPQ54636.1 hypothetical protein GLOTRDRAFT_106294 [Gloeophyllum trabeum ATCC 11539]
MAVQSINYSQIGGIHSVAAAVIFAIIYFPLLIYNIIRSVKRPTYVLIVLALFCAIRVTAFSVRAALAGSSDAAENENLFIAEQVLYLAGFFGVLYSAYTLVLDREQLTGEQEFPGPISAVMRISGNRHLIRLTLTVAIALGITGAIRMTSGDASKMATGETMRRVSTYIFLVVTILLALRTMFLALEQSGVSSGRPTAHSAFGARHGVFVLLGIAILLLLREAFQTATTGSKSTSMQDKAYNEALFYPLSALPEFLAVVLFAVPGLVPSRKELQEYSAVIHIPAA